VHTIHIDTEKCIGCKKCYLACFVDVIRWDEGAKRPRVQYPEECATCYCCELICPVNAMEVIPDNPPPMPEPYPKSAYPKSYVRTHSKEGC
jgi:NAD-dependent dihydropyrimidine dehydrogenase PreA subunit